MILMLVKYSTQNQGCFQEWKARMANEAQIQFWDKKNNEQVTLVQGVGLINTKHPDGTPALVTMMQPEHQIELAGGEEFIVFWADKRMIRST
jgi:hypothetical protein